MDSLWSALIGGAVGAVVAAIGTFWQSWVSTRVRVDEALRERREADYLTLWKLTGILPKWPKARVTYGEIDQQTQALRDWYFSGGGLYLSTEARTTYGAAQKALCSAVETAQTPELELAPKDYDRLQESLSALRTELTRDLLSRERRVLRLFTGRPLSGRG